MSRVAVMGSGSWGTAFALILSDAGNQVTMWARRAELASAINSQHRNVDYFPGLQLPDSLTAVTDPDEAMQGAEFVVLAVPSQSLRANLGAWSIPTEAVVVSLAKGIEQGTGLRMSQVIAQTSNVVAERIAVVSGPNLSREIADRKPSASVVASTSIETAAALQAICHTPHFRPYTNTDVIGTELSGATKNVIALAVGIGVGIGLGDNASASVITRGLAETTRLGLVLGADPYTFSGLAGLGDLVATCSSPLSRNRTFGEKLGRGMSVEEVQQSTRQTAEGVKSCRSILDLARAHGIDVPLTEAVVRVCHEDEAPAQMVREIMSREAKPE